MITPTHHHLNPLPILLIKIMVAEITTEAIHTTKPPLTAETRTALNGPTAPNARMTLAHHLKTNTVTSTPERTTTATAIQVTRHVTLHSTTSRMSRE